MPARLAPHRGGPVDPHGLPVGPCLSQTSRHESWSTADIEQATLLRHPQGKQRLLLRHRDDGGLLSQPRTFLTVIGPAFCSCGSEFPVQVGGRDFALDLLFFHRGLNCLVAIELKVDRFEPEHLGKLNFYLEALDRDVSKPHKNTALGRLLCSSKDSDVVESALSRTLYPTLV